MSDSTFPDHEDYERVADSGRRRLLSTTAWLAGGTLLGSGLLAYRKLSSLPEGDSRHATDRAMQEANAEMARWQERIARTVLNDKRGLAALDKDDLGLIREDPKTLKKLFPDLSPEDLRSIPPVAGWSEGVYITVDPRGIITAYRQTSESSPWERAGFSAPDGVGISEDAAFACGSKPPGRSAGRGY